MIKQWILLTVVVAAVVFGIVSCSKNSSSPTQPQTSTSQLTAVPASVAVGMGTVQTVSISGGTPPYSVASAPSSIVTAVLSNSQSMVATLTITGVTVATASTSVTVRDSAAAKAVTVPISVH